MRERDNERERERERMRERESERERERERERMRERMREREREKERASERDRQRKRKIVTKASPAVCSPVSIVTRAPHHYTHGTTQTSKFSYSRLKLVNFLTRIS